MDEAKQKTSDIPLGDLDYELTRTRAALSQEAISRYAEMIRNGIVLDPAVIFRSNDGKLWPATGEHRKRAYEAAHKESMPCVFLVGDQQAAIEYGIRDNAKHGAHLTPADKQHNIALMLQAHPDWTDRQIGDFCSVDHKTVGRHRTRLETSGALPHSDKRIDKHGRSHPATQPPKRPSGEATGSNAIDHEVEQASGSASDAREEILQPTQVKTGTKPYGKSAAELYMEMSKTLGKFHNPLSTFNEIHPDGRRYRECQRLLARLGQELGAWRKEVGIRTDFDVAA